MAPKRKPETVNLVDDDDEEVVAAKRPKRSAGGSSKRRPSPAAAAAAAAIARASGASLDGSSWDGSGAGGSGAAGPSTSTRPAAARARAGSKPKKKERVWTGKGGHGAVAAALAAADAAAAAPAAAAAAAAPKPKPKKKAAAGEEPRLDEHGHKVMYRPRASQDVQARIERAMPGSSHRMFLVDSRQLAPAGSPGGPSQEFQVLGATGNVYAVRISCQPSCTCPDFGKGHLCKHILFVMLRVLRQRQDDPVIWQRALLKSEAERVLSVMGGVGGAAGAGGAGGAVVVDQSVLASERVRQRFAAIVGGSSRAGGRAAAAGGGGAEAAGRGVQRPVEGECPICCEEMVAPGGGGGRGEAISFCGCCGNNLHKDCFGRWASIKRSSGQQVTCVYCRAPWQEGGAPAAPAVAAAAGAGSSAGAGGGGQYVNLSQYSEEHQQARSLQDLYGSSAYWIMANSGQMGRQDAARMYAAERGWS